MNVLSDHQRTSHRVYLEVLRSMSAEDRLRKAFELSELARSLFVHGLRRRFPELDAESFRQLVRNRLDKCHNRNY
jgi:hypothetical protein